MAQTQQPFKTIRPSLARLEPLAQANRTKHLILVLRDALATEITAATRTAGNRFPMHVIETALVREILHDSRKY